MVELRTARANHIPHSTLRFPERKRKHPDRWTVKDSILQLALTMYEDGLCPKCGHPRDRSWNEDMDGWYKAHRATCVACRTAALETASQPLRADEMVYVTDDSPDGLVPDPQMAHKG